MMQQVHVPVVEFDTDCCKTEKAPTWDRTTVSKRVADKDHSTKSTNDTLEVPQELNKQQSPDVATATGHSQLPRVRVRRLSEHGCECCWLGLDGNSSPSNAPCVLQSQLSAIPECHQSESAATPVSSIKYVSPFAGLALNIPDLGPEQVHQWPGGKSSNATVPAGQPEPERQLTDADGSPVPVFAVVSIMPRHA